MLVFPFFFSFIIWNGTIILLLEGLVFFLFTFPFILDHFFFSLSCFFFSLCVSFPSPFIFLLVVPDIILRQKEGETTGRIWCCCLLFLFLFNLPVSVMLPNAKRKEHAFVSCVFSVQQQAFRVWILHTYAISLK